MCQRTGPKCGQGRAGSGLIINVACRAEPKKVGPLTPLLYNLKLTFCVQLTQLQVTSSLRISNCSQIVYNCTLYSIHVARLAFGHDLHLHYYRIGWIDAPSLIAEASRAHRSSRRSRQSPGPSMRSRKSTTSECSNLLQQSTIPRSTSTSTPTHQLHLLHQHSRHANSCV